MMTNLLLGQTGSTGLPMALGLALVLVVIVLFTMLILVLKQYKRCPSNRVLVIFGRMNKGQTARCIHGGAKFVLPLLETPLGPSLGDIRLRDVARADRLDELGFELPLAGGDRPAGVLTLGRLAAVLRDHLDPEDPLAGYAQRLEDPRLRQTVRGYLTGSLDLVIPDIDR